jgi:hypothetical protein
MAWEQITKSLTGADLGGTNFTLCEEFTNPPEESTCHSSVPPLKS